MQLMQVTYMAILCIPVVSGYDVLVHGEDGLCVDPHPRHLHRKPQSATISHQSSVISRQSSVISHQSSVINHQPSVTNYFKKPIFWKGKIQNVEELTTEHPRRKIAALQLTRRRL
jgi:hypothetical protein